MTWEQRIKGPAHDSMRMAGLGPLGRVYKVVFCDSFSQVSTTEILLMIWQDPNPKIYPDSFGKFLSGWWIWVQVWAIFIRTRIWVTQNRYFYFFRFETPIFHSAAPLEPYYTSYEHLKYKLKFP